MNIVSGSDHWLLAYTASQSHRGIATPSLAARLNLFVSNFPGGVDLTLPSAYVVSVALMGKSFRSVPGNARSAPGGALCMFSTNDGSSSMRLSSGSAALCRISDRL